MANALVRIASFSIGGYKWEVELVDGCSPSSHCRLLSRKHRCCHILWHIVGCDMFDMIVGFRRGSSKGSSGGRFCHCYGVSCGLYVKSIPVVGYAVGAVAVSLRYKFRPRQNYASATKQSTQKKKTKIPEVFQIPDQKLRLQLYAMEQIDAKLQKNQHYEILLNDLVWYITQEKPRAGHMKAQLNQDCIGIQRMATKEFRQACNETVDFTQMELPKMATIECNKLKNTSNKIMIEMKKAEEVHRKLKSLHDVCMTVVAAMSSGNTTKHDLAADVLTLNTRIDSKADHLQQLLHPIKNTVDSMKQGLVRMEMEMKILRRTVEQIQQQKSQSTLADHSVPADNTHIINELRNLRQ